MHSRSALVSLLALALSGHAFSSVSAQDPTRVVRPTDRPDLFVAAPHDLVPGPVVSSTRLVVRFREAVRAAELDRYLQPFDARVAETGYGGAFEVLEVPRGTLDGWVHWLRQQDAVLYAEPEGLVRATGTPPNDTYWAYQWHLMDRGMTSGSAVSNHGVQAPEAWTKSTGAGAVVAIVDTGVAYENFGAYQRAPDLANTSFVAGWDFVNNDAHANDDEGHGTHVAGTIGQSTNNNLGVAGVAYDATIMPVKVLDSTGSGSTTWVANGIRYAADHGADVINLSLGSSFGSTVLEDAVNYAWNAGVVVCAATGNGGNGTIGYPARYTNCIAVGATRFDGARAYYSQFGNGIDVVAPGGDVTVDQNGDGYGDGVLQQTFSGAPTNFGYYFFQGTSMATPHVAGIAALVKAAKPSATNAEIRAAIESSCLDLGASGYDTTFGAGLVDANAAVDAILGSGGGGDPPPAAPTGLGATAGDGTVALDWNDNGEADLAGYNVYRATSSGGPYTRVNGALVASSAYVDNAVTNGTAYFYVVTAVDVGGNESGNSDEASATPQGGGDTTPPAVPQNLTSSSSGGTVTLDWDDNTEPDLAGYHVYRATHPRGPWDVPIAFVTSSSYVDGPLSPDRYVYRVSAEDTSGNESDLSSQTNERIR